MSSIVFEVFGTIYISIFFMKRLIHAKKNIKKARKQIYA